MSYQTDPDDCEHHSLSNIEWEKFSSDYRNESSKMVYFGVCGLCGQELRKTVITNETIESA